MTKQPIIRIAILEDESCYAEQRPRISCGERNTTEKHRKLFAYHGWQDHYKVDLLDAEGPDLELPIPS